MSKQERIYEKDLYSIKKYNDRLIKITYLASSRIKGFEIDRKHKAKNTVNNEKLDNNLARAKSIVKEYALCNPWDYWCTFTISPDRYDRYNLSKYQKDFSEFIHNLNRNRTHKIKYLLVPELHKDNAWHMHGFIYGLESSDLSINQNGYFTWTKYNNKFGFMSLDKIKNIEKMSNYCLKYMTKDLTKNVSILGCHLYYSSQGLKTAEKIYFGKGILHSQWDWSHPDGYCKIKNLNIDRTTLEEIFEVL